LAVICSEAEDSAVKSALLSLVLTGLAVSSIAATDEAWPWTDDHGGNSDVTLLLLGDINVEQRADPATAFMHIRPTLAKADLVYGNLEGLLVKSDGPDKDIPDKSGWQHIGPEAVRALKAGNIAVVGVANNVAYGRDNILKSLSVLDANGILHTGAGKNLEEAHRPAIVERRGVRFGFLQYTAKWYRADQQIATDSAPGVARVYSRNGMTVDPADLNRIREDIRKLRRQVDVVVVSSHNRDGMGRDIPESGPGGAGESANGGASRDSLFAPIPLGPRFSEAEDYEKELARAAIDAGADIAYGHGSHVLQGVEVYKDKPIMYCMGNSATDWIRMRPNKEGMVARVVVRDKHVARVTLVPMTRDDENNVVMLDPSSPEGTKLREKVKSLSEGVGLNVVGREMVLTQ
jgi:poly-gamma-glutamate capsule biosynthesis protein CapA/YwtB (metallophosphatase superfamily)